MAQDYEKLYQEALKALDLVPGETIREGCLRRRIEVSALRSALRDTLERFKVSSDVASKQRDRIEDLEKEIKDNRIFSPE